MTDDGQGGDRFYTTSWLEIIGNEWHGHQRVELDDKKDILDVLDVGPLDASNEDHRRGIDSDWHHKQLEEHGAGLPHGKWLVGKNQTRRPDGDSLQRELRQTSMKRLAEHSVRSLDVARCLAIRRNLGPTQMEGCRRLQEGLGHSWEH